MRTPYVSWGGGGISPWVCMNCSAFVSHFLKERNRFCGATNALKNPSRRGTKKKQPAQNQTQGHKQPQWRATDLERAGTRGIATTARDAPAKAHAIGPQGRCGTCGRLGKALGPIPVEGAVVKGKCGEGVPTSSLWPRAIFGKMRCNTWDRKPMNDD